MSNFLDEMKPHTQRRVSDMGEILKRRNTRAGGDFLEIFTHKKPAIIAEVKFSSPSKGVIYKGKMNAVEIAGSYLKNGASALSVLTEPDYFKGNISYLEAVREAYPECNLLMKDFVLSDKQIIQGYNHGASAVLLIVGFLNDPELSLRLNFTSSMGLTPLVEIHTREEWNRISLCPPKLIGINNRNLNTMKIDLNVSRELIKVIKDHDPTIKVISESGIENAQAIQELTELGFDGFLIGSKFMESDNPGVALGNLLKELE